jgi:ligand-binding SRPBCC domain-containing protein
VRRLRLAATADEVYAWHAAPGALQRLTPPWEKVEVVRDGGLHDGAEVVLRLRLGPFSRLWVARLADCVPGRGFRDRQIRGPFAWWEHTHTMEPAAPAAQPTSEAPETAAGGSYLIDRVAYVLPFGALGRWIAGGWARRKIDRMFEYRHAVTSRALGTASASASPVDP